MDFEPVVAEPAQRESQDARGEVGQLFAVREDEEAAIVGDQTEPAGALARGPADPAVAGLEVEGGDTEGEQGDPSAVEFADIAKAGAVERGLVEVRVGLEPAVGLLALVGFDQTHADALEQIRFDGRIGAIHRQAWTRVAKKYQPQRESIRCPNMYPPADEAALTNRAQLDTAPGTEWRSGQAPIFNRLGHVPAWTQGSRPDPFPRFRQRSRPEGRPTARPIGNRRSMGSATLRPNQSTSLAAPPETLPRARPPATPWT